MAASSREHLLLLRINWKLQPDFDKIIAHEIFNILILHTSNWRRKKGHFYIACTSSQWRVWASVLLPIFQPSWIFSFDSAESQFSHILLSKHSPQMQGKCFSLPYSQHFPEERPRCFARLLEVVRRSPLHFLKMSGSAPHCTHLVDTNNIARSVYQRYSKKFMTLLFVTKGCKCRRPQRRRATQEPWGMCWQ